MPVIKTLKNGVWTKVSTFGELATATSSLNGLMSSADKAKLDKTETRTLLWTNPNPTSSFAGQTISLDLSEYDEIEIENNYYQINGDVTTTQYVKCKIGNSVCLVTFHALGTSNVNKNISSRYITVNSNGVVITDNQYKDYINGGLTVSNNTNKPIRIYGIKVG